MTNVCGLNRNVFLFLSFALSFGALAQAQEEPEVIGKVTAIKGSVWVKAPDSEEKRSVG